MNSYDLTNAFELAACLISRLKRDLFCGMRPLESQFALAAKQTPFKERKKLTYHPIAIGETWGHAWQTGWFHFQGLASASPEADCIPVIRINTGSEALLFSSKGEALTGLTSHCWFADDFVRDEYYPTETPSGILDYWCAVTANKLAGMDVDYDPDASMKKNGSFSAVFKTAEAGWMRTQVKGLILDLTCLLSLAETLPENDYRRKSMALAFNRADATYSGNPAYAPKARACLTGFLSRPAYADAVTVTAIGHSHLDTAYMWPVRETVHKAARTWATQLALIEAYPDYVFGASTPLHYQMVKENYPKIFARIRKAVLAGRWEPLGGMWVEADINIPDGESLVRQFIHGKNFFRDEYGIDVRNTWLPDDFGYSGSLPQIMKLANCGSFVSIKVARNDLNTFPYHTFRWRGIDGSEVLAHLPPEGFYSSSLQPKTLCKAQDDYAESAETGEFLSLFGMGDGGGGATREDVEAGHRLANLEGAPKVIFGAAQPALDRLKKCWAQLPTWDGEIYFERHRGITSSLARYKRANRKNEQRLAQTEYLCALLLEGDAYPMKTLDRAWKLLLTHQFHDTISGTSIDETYQEVDRDYAELTELCRQAQELAQKQLTQASGYAVLLNSLNAIWHGTVTLPAEWEGMEVVCNGRNLPAARNEKGIVQVLVTIPPMASIVLQKGKRRLPATKRRMVFEGVLENSEVRYVFDQELRLTSAYDKRRGLELIPRGSRGNDLRLYRDYPNKYEAWDVDRHYRDGIPESPTNISGKLLRIGDNILEAEMQLGKSRIRQRAILDDCSMTLTFDTEVEWHEKRKLLRVAFPTTLTSDFGTYDMQFGSLRRPTGENTSWDVARFETLMHKYMDLSDNGYGISILNDCKYGGRVYPQGLELTLLRSTCFPSLHAEEGHQEFRYAFHPHKGTCAEAKVARTAECFNREPLLLMGCDMLPSLPFTLDGDDVTLAAFKRAERGNERIVRLVERYGKHATVTITADARHCLGECDLLEWEKPAVTEKALRLSFHPFEIKTIMLLPLPAIGG